MKTKITKPKPRVMWANYYPTMGAPVVHPVKQSADIGAAGLGQTVRVAVIPLDDVEALVERAALAYVNSTRKRLGLTAIKRLSIYSNPSRVDVAAALTAAGIPCKQRRAKP